MTTTKQKVKATNRETGALKRTIRANVLNHLAESLPDDFDELMTQEYAAHGLTYVRPLTKAEKEAKRNEEKRAKAAERLAAILAEYPDLEDPREHPLEIEARANGQDG